MIILDFETNSSNSKDVIEVGAYKIIKKNNEYVIIDMFHRYYFSKYEINYFALDVHNLSPDRIKKLRANVKYPKYFEDDKDFLDFCKDSSILVAHNVSFELRYLDDIFIFENTFCTMKENKKVVNSKNKNGHLKNPTLVETCEYYNIKFDYLKYHSAIYDAEKTLEILNCMNSIENNFDIINYTIQEQERIKLEKIKNKFSRELKREKQKIKKMFLVEEKKRTCPKCNSNNVHKKGIRHRKDYKVQRYQCQNCKSIYQEKISDLQINTCLLSEQEIEKMAKENLFKKAVEKRDEKLKKINNKNSCLNDVKKELKQSDNVNKIKEDSNYKNNFFERIFTFFKYFKT